jgi:hypothetical protein
LTLSRKSGRRTRTGILRVPEWCEVVWCREKTGKRVRRTSEGEREREREESFIDNQESERGAY